MFDIVAQVDKYKEFVPWCTHSTIYNKRPGFLNCKLAVGFPPLMQEKYNSAVTLHRPNMVKVGDNIFPTLSQSITKHEKVAVYQES